MGISTRLARLQERVRTCVSQVALFPAIRLLEDELATRSPIGTHHAAADERVHFSHPPSFALPAGEVLDVVYRRASGVTSVTVKTALLGLVGAESPLPSSMSEEALFDEDDALAPLYDVLHHRALSLLYCAWKRYTPGASADASHADPYADALLSLVGQDVFSPYGDGSDADAPPATVTDPFVALGLSDFARCEPNFLDTSALEQLIDRIYPELHARVSRSEPRLVRAADEDRGCLGQQHSTLGVDAPYGASALDPSGVVRIEVGPVDGPTHETLRPGGARYRQLQPLIDEWLASRAVAELDILIQLEEAPALVLGEGYGGSLGGDAQYHRTDARHVRARVLLAPESEQAMTTYLDETAVAILARAEDSVEAAAASAHHAADLWQLAMALLKRRPLPADVQSAVSSGHLVAGKGRTDAALDLLIGSLDQAIGHQVDAILHHPTLQALEARWRGLSYLTNQLPPEQNVVLAILSFSKEELITDLDGATELTRTHFFASVYTGELGMFGGEPYGAVLADMDFDGSSGDVRLLRQLSAVSAMAHAPFFSGASRELLQLASWRELPRMRSVQSTFDSPTKIAWHALRDASDSRAAGLLVGRPLYRLPYSADLADTTFVYAETVAADAAELLFGSPIYVLANRFAASFARHRTLAAIIGDDEDASVPPVRFPFPSLGARHARQPLEVTITPRLAHELCDAGLIILASRNDGRLFLPTANSLQRPKTFSRTQGGAEATLNHLLGTKFPYFTVACRFAHYLKVLEREMSGAHRSAAEVEQNLNEWLAGYVLQMSAASAAMRARYPLRGARVVVREVEGSAGWYRGELELRPHLRFLDRFFALSVSNLIPKIPGSAVPTKLVAAA
jgi:type VI secretion system protein ImpC